MTIVDISHPIDAATPHPPSAPAPAFEVCQELGPQISQITAFSLNSHMGTHMDAASHFVPGARTITDYPADRFVRPAVMVRVPRGTEVIDVPLLAEVEQHVRPGHAVLFATGSDVRYGTPEYHDHPYLSVDAARWLTAHEVSLVGVDFMTPDMPIGRRPEGYRCPVHQELLGHDVLIIENLTGLYDLDDVVVELLAAPLPLRSVDGAQVRALARTGRKEEQ